MLQGHIFGSFPMDSEFDDGLSTPLEGRSTPPLYEIPFGFKNQESAKIAERFFKNVFQTKNRILSLSLIVLEKPEN